jgi:hypothetical protein
LKATIYTRVSNRKILNWIQEQTDTNPLVMVIGGYTEVKEKRRKLVPKAFPGPTNSIEIISKSSSCRLGVSPAFGRKFEYGDGDQYNEADAIGPTGQFTKDAPIYCGGKSKAKNLENCWEYDYRAN